MNPKQRLLVVIEDLAVKLLVLVVGAVLRGLRPQRIGIVDQLRALFDLEFLLLRLLVLSALILLLRLDRLQHDIVRAALRLADRLGLLRVLHGQVDLGRHEAAVLLQDLLRAVIIGELHTVLGEIQCDLCAEGFPLAVLHRELARAVALPVNRLRAVLIGERVDRDLLRHHECRVEAQAEVTDDLVVIRLVLVLGHERLRAGERDVIDVFLDLVRRHADTVVDDLNRLLLRIQHDIDARLVALGQLELAHHVKFLELCDRVASVRDQLPVENVVVAVQPFLDNREHILAVD